MMDIGPTRWARPSVILVATDLGDLDHLMSFALQQAQLSQARIILLHVLGAGAGITADPAGMPYYDPASAIDFAIKTLEPWRMMARAQELQCDAVVREGHPAQQIIAAARQFRAERLLLGTRSRSKVSKLLLGSVAEQVLRSVNLPVITVGPEAHLQAAMGDSERVVLHATTLRETSCPSAALACEIAAAHKAKLVLMHVLPPIDEMRREHLPTGLDSTAIRELRILATEVGANDLCCAQVETRIAHGHPAIEILAASADLGASLIVLGSTARSILHNLTHDRTIYRVLAHARCPVMTLRDTEESAPSLSPEHDAIHL
ncbi:MAG TPA: universal stress protein [Terracidiphilus sp.]|jgi:nucleotide-binding universal stress UspA family protein